MFIFSACQAAKCKFRCENSDTGRSAEEGVGHKYKKRGGQSLANQVQHSSIAAEQSGAKCITATGGDRGYKRVCHEQRGSRCRD